MTLGSGLASNVLEAAPEPMKVFACSACGQSLFFENVQCTRCGRRLAYLPDQGILSPIERPKEPGGAKPSKKDAPAAPAVPGPPDPLDGTFQALAPVAKGALVRLCRNYVENGACNWAVPVADDTPFCLAC